VRVLVVEDDPGIARSLVRGLDRAGYTAQSVGTGRAALAVEPAPDAVLLDLGHRTVIADVSHQLRTPPAALRLRLDLLAADADGEAAQELSGAQEEIARLSRLVDGLLAVARAESAVLEQILDNLIANALDAVPGGGRVRIEAAPTPGLYGLPGLQGSPGGGAVRLRVIDDGQAPTTGVPRGRDDCGHGRAGPSPGSPSGGRSTSRRRGPWNWREWPPAVG
jgi:signal transduction histidine kinase